MTMSNPLKQWFSYFDSSQTECGGLSMFIPKGEKYDSKPYSINKTCLNYGWNRVMDWSRFGWLASQY
jgi:hypothetical protein